MLCLKRNLWLKRYEYVFYYKEINDQSKIYIKKITGIVSWKVAFIENFYLKKHMSRAIISKARNFVLRLDLLLFSRVCRYIFGYFTSSISTSLFRDILGFPRFGFAIGFACYPRLVGRTLMTFFLYKEHSFRFFYILLQNVRKHEACLKKNFWNFSKCG